MDFAWSMVPELVCLTVDACLFGLVFKLYQDRRRDAKALRNALILEIDGSLAKLVSESPGQIIPYAIVTGSVKAIGQTLTSQRKPQVTGVMQESILKEHQIKWSWTSRWWSDVERIVRHKVNVVPFVLEGSNFDTVQVLEPTYASKVDMTTVYDEFQQSQQNFGEVFFSFLLGERSKGFQEIENMLTEGTLLTAAGELIYENNRVCIQPPQSKNARYFLMQVSRQTMIKKLDSEGNVYRMFSVIFGVVGSCLIAWTAHQCYQEFMRRKELAIARRRLEEIRLERIRRARDLNDQNIPKCIICLTNPREILLLDCGHVCLCVDCALQLNPYVCPMCRSKINDTVPAYIS